MYPIITISREFGSGGHSIGKAVAEALGIPFYDSEIVNKAAEVSGYTKDFIEQHGENTSGLDQWLYGGAFAAGYVKSPQDEIFRVQSRIILDYAQQGPCVIVGRCADYILERRNVPSLNILIHADMEHRKARILERYGNNDVPVERRIRTKDKGRQAYYRYYTDRKWGNYMHYHLSLDSGFLGEETCVKMIVDLAKKMDAE